MRAEPDPKVPILGQELGWPQLWEMDLEQGLGA